jgi:nucleoside-triphosphatase THEP1
MIHIVTGKMNAGKSTKLGSIYNELQKGDGFISVKRMHYDKVHGYEIMRLSTKAFLPLVMREEFSHTSIDVACQIGPYLFLSDTLKYVENEIEEMIKNAVSPIFLDEIGQLELYDQCFSDIFQKMVNSGLEIYITVREDLVEKIIEKFQIKKVDIIKA